MYLVVTLLVELFPPLILGDIYFTLFFYVQSIISANIVYISYTCNIYILSNIVNGAKILVILNNLVMLSFFLSNLYKKTVNGRPLKSIYLVSIKL